MTDVDNGEMVAVVKERESNFKKKIIVVTLILIIIIAVSVAIGVSSSGGSVEL